MPDDSRADARCADCGEVTAAGELQRCRDCGRDICDFCAEGAIVRGGELIVRCERCHGDR